MAWCQILGDDRQHLVDTLKDTFSRDDIVFSCGGIGSTPDDHTRQASALALGKPLVLHPEAAALIRERARDTGSEADDIRLRMGEFPEGAAIIPNPYNKIAGFSIKNHHFVPGFPVMAWPMIEWVLDTHYAHLHFSQVEHVRAMRVFKGFEAMLTPLMEEMETRFPGYTIYSLPHVGDNTLPKHIELGVKCIGASLEKQLDEIFLLLKSRVEALGLQAETLGQV